MKQLLEKIQKLKESGSYDLSTEEDLSIAVMNLVSLEEHFFFTAEKTGKDEYLELMAQVREMRKELLARMIDRHEGETWCVAKHLLAATMRLIEVGTKLYADGMVEDAQSMFRNAYKLYAFFWSLRLKLISAEGLKEVSGKLNIHDTAADHSWTHEDIVSQLVDCCKE